MNTLIFKDEEWMNYFDPLQIFRCGQAFHWHREEDESITAVHGESWINVKKEDTTVCWQFSDKDEEGKWLRYFDLNTDYSKIVQRVSKISLMQEAAQYGKGIRILRQEPFETIMTFILSANNHIPRIKKGVEDLSRIYGKEITPFRDRKLYAFPTVEEFEKISKEELREVIKVGYRDKAMVETCKKIASGDFDMEKTADLSTEKLRKELLTLPGVGPKVADCILLFAYNRMEVFPVDVWIHRVMEDYFFNEKGSKKEIHRKSTEIFGKDAGYAQQYLFFYGRAFGIGKKGKKPKER